MMREIKFRAKSLCKGENFVYGYLIHCNRNPQREKWMIQEPDTGIGTDVDEATIGQFTCLKDKNGKEIYEGDIVKYTRYNFRSEWLKEDLIEEIHVVYWNEEKHAFYCRTKFESGGGASGFLIFKDDRAEREEIEVIGNIYDNPDMLK